MIQYGAAVLAKDMAIPCGLRLVLDHLGSSESINSALLDYWLPGTGLEMIRAPDGAPLI